MSIMNILFPGGERGVIRRAAVSIWEQEHPPGQGVQPAEQKFPNVDPRWDNNNLGDRTKMQDLQGLIIKGIRELAPRSQNVSKVFEVQQEKEETPTAFSQRLRDQMRKYSGLDPEDQVGQGILKVNFVTKSWPNIAKKLQNLDGWNEKPIEELLREAQKVFVRREARSLYFKLLEGEPDPLQWAQGELQILEELKAILSHHPSPGTPIIREAVSLVCYC